MTAMEATIKKLKMAYTKRRPENYSQIPFSVPYHTEGQSRFSENLNYRWKKNMNLINHL